MTVGFLTDFSYEALGSNDRLDEPMVRDLDGKLRVTSWEVAVNKAKELISKSKKFNGLISGNVDGGNGPVQENAQGA